ncbi:hypothetical protein ES705_35249 [subsurface metagenome]
MKRKGGWGKPTMLGIPIDLIPYVEELKKYYSISTLDRIVRFGVVAMIRWHMYRVRMDGMKGRRQEVANLLLDGLSRKQIEERLKCSYQIVVADTDRICEVFQCKSVVEFVAKYGWLMTVVPGKDWEDVNLWK